MSKGAHCENLLVSGSVYRAPGEVVGSRRQDVLVEGSTTMTSETSPVGRPYASSSDATNSAPAGRGRNVTTAPVAVVEFQAKEGITMAMGVELKGTTVNVSGRDAGTLPPEKLTLKDPHCVTEEKEMVLKCEWTAGGPNASSTARTRA